MRIGIAFDLAPATAPADGPDDRFEEFDKPETVEAIAEALRGAGHDVVLLGDGRPFLERVLADPPDFVWNIAEGEGQGRCREARVPAVLEMLGIPFTGSDPLTLAAALDKDVARRLVADRGVPVPRGEVLPADADGRMAADRVDALEADSAFPLILKPAQEGSSKGIRDDGLADTPGQAVALFERLARLYDQPILLEQFIEGDELTVGLVGNGNRLEVLGVMQIAPRGPAGRFVYSLEVKRDWAARVEYLSPPPQPAGVIRAVEHAARLAYEALGCRDFARVDFRVRGGVPYFIEANPLPGLAPATSDLVILAETCGVDHPTLILRILDVSLRRVGLARMTS